MLTTQQLIAKYGQPGTANLNQMPLPFPMRIAWDTATTITKIQVHKLVAPKLQAVFQDLLAHYGLPEIQRLGIDLFAGCYNYRKMRGGDEWSRHAWGVAID